MSEPSATEVSSLDHPASDDDNKVFTFGAERFSDITIHYQSSSYHMHQYMLATGSKYFDTVLTDTTDSNKCMVSEQCNKPLHRRCIELTGTQIGGVDVSIHELNTFFRSLYAEARPEWREMLMSERQNGTWPSHYYIAKVVSSDTTPDEMHIDSYELDGVRRHVVKRHCVTESVLSWTSWTNRNWLFRDTLAEHKNHHLADYFQCTSMLAIYEKQALVNVEAVLQASPFHPSLWRLLILCDRYNWPTARKVCLEACAKHKSCNTFKHWGTIVTQLKSATMTELFIAAVNRKTP